MLHFLFLFREGSLMKSVISSLLQAFGTSMMFLSLAFAAAMAVADDPGIGSYCEPNGAILCINRGCPPSIPSCGRLQGECTCK